MNYTSGMQIYKYHLTSKIGGGEFGEVWTADDKAIDTRLAVKLLDQVSCSIDERLLEAQIGNRLLHPNVINIKYADVISIGDPPTPVVIIAMPYYSNGSVVSKVNAANFLDLDKALCCLIDVLRGLEYLHEIGYYHCDIKPQNILVGDNGEHILTDYGITCHSPSHTAVSPRGLYLPHAASESISNNEYDARTDIYQLGLTAFRLVNGISTIKDAFVKDCTAFKQSILDGKVITDSSFQPYVPHRLRRVILKAASLLPDDRYQSAIEMRRELERIDLKDSTVTADEHGKILVRKSGYTYYYEIAQGTKGATMFRALKENMTSRRVTQVASFACQVKNQNDIKKAAKKFFLSLL